MRIPKTQSLKKALLPVGLLLSCSSLFAGDFTPIPLDPASFNADPVIEKTAPPSINDYVTVTPDQGTNKNGNTWFEKGYNTTNLNMGCPVHNSIVTDSTGTHSFQMPPDYHTNNVLFFGHNSSSWTPILGPATFTLSTPAAYSYLSVLSGSGNGAVLVHYIVHHADNSTEEGTFSSTDWWNGTTVNKVFDANGLVGLNGGLNNMSTNHGSAFYSDLQLQNPSSPVTSVDFEYYGQNATQNPFTDGRTFIFALSGSSDGTTFTPITVTGYNQKGILAADAPATSGTGVAPVLTNDTYCTFTMDGGIYKANWTMFERGYYAAYPDSGLPAAGSTITSETDPAIHYTLPSTYAGNCAVCLSSNLTTANIKFATPASYGSLSFLTAAGNGAMNVRVEVQFSGGATETNWISTVDWFNSGSPGPAWICFGQVNPSARAVRNTPDQLVNPFTQISANPPVIATGLPFMRDPRNGGAYSPGYPIIRLYDLIVPITNTASITGVTLVTTNVGMWNNTAAILAVSGNAGAPPIITQPASFVTDSATGAGIATNGAAVPNNIVITKGYQGINDITLWVSNQLGSAVSYQWKKAPRGGGWRDIYRNFDLGTFVNVSGPNISGANASSMTISNATLNDTGDYIVVASNPYGAMTSFVATVSVLSTNSSVLVGQGGGDIVSKWSTDGNTSGEDFTHAIDQVQQKWLSLGLGSVGFGGMAIGGGTTPFTGPVGFTVIPVNGASIVNAVRIYCANDTQGRDPGAYLLEGSNDGSTWTTISGGPLTGTLMLPTARGGTGSTPLDPMTQPLTEVDFANATVYKQYRVTIPYNIDPAGNALMQVAEVQLLGTLQPNPPVWVRQPVPSVTVFAGTSPTWGASAAGYPEPRYTWYRNGTAIPNATNSTYTLVNAQLTDTGAQISCVATNNGGRITSTSSTLTVIAAPTQAYVSSVLADGPMGLWRLDEGPDNGAGNYGVVAKDYAGGHNGYYTNVTLGVPGFNPTADSDTAALFGPVNNLGIAADNAVMNINDTDFARNTNTLGATFSVEAWVAGGTQTTNGAIVTKGYDGGLLAGTATGTEQYALGLSRPSDSPALAFRFLVRDYYGNGHVAQSSVVPAYADQFLLTPTWHHLVGACDQPNGKVYLYVDGLLAATGTIPTNAGILAQSLPMTIGSRQSTSGASFSDQWNGTIDEVAMYPKVLSPDQVLAHFYAAQRGPLITLQPTNSITVPANAPVTFYAYAYGPGTLSYQWYLSDGYNPTAPVSGQTASNMTFTTTAAQNGNQFQLVVTNNYGAVTSSIALLNVVSGSPSFIADLPASQTVYVGHPIQLHVYAGGTAPFTYQWQKNGVNITDDYRTSGSKTDTLTIGYAATTDTGNYQVIVTGSQGTGSSTMDAITVVMGSPNYFSVNSADWTLQGSPIFTEGTSIQLTTSGETGTARSAWMTAKKDITAFNASYIYQVASGAGGADGMTFCIQNQSVTALGGGGGSLGYAGITPSVALGINIYNGNNTRGIEFLNNVTATITGTPILPVDLGNNTNKVRVDLQYASGNLKATFTDLVTGGTYVTNYTVNIPSVVGANTAWVGFTGADGGVSSTQIVFINAGGANQAIPLTAQHVGNTLVFTWPTSGGAILQCSPSLTTPVWTTCTAPFTIVGNQAQVTVSQLTGNQFYRLQLFP